MKKIITIVAIIGLPLFAQDITSKLGASGNYDVTDSNDNVLLRVEENGDVGIGTDSPMANLDIHGTVKAFGEWDESSYITETVYQAPTDGFVCAYLMNSGVVPFGKIAGYTDSNNPPAETHPKAISSLTYEVVGGRDFMYILMPVKKNDYWKVTDGASGGNSFIAGGWINWIPLGQ